MVIRVIHGLIIISLKYWEAHRVLYFNPPPPVGTLIAVEVDPYNGYGCLDTLYARLIDTLTVISNAGRDTLSCNGNLVPIGANPKPGLIYSWNPPTGSD